MSPSASPAQGRILVADDMPEVLDIVESLLTDAGHTVVTAPDGARAMDELRSSSFDMVLTDIDMPDATGVDVLRAVRERDLDTPVVLITGNPTVKTAVQGLELGAMRYLSKPVEASLLLEVVRQGLALRRLSQLRRAALAELGGMDRLLADRAGLEAVFPRALAGLYFDYQPVVRAGDGAAFGHEALLRSREPALAQPLALLEAAERLGRLQLLGRQVRAQAAADLERLPSRTVLVNLHPLDLKDPQLLEDDAPLSRHARSVILEITERASLQGVGELREKVARLRALGYRIAVDDLGAGYAGLATFTQLEPDLVKLDMSLIRDVDRHPLRQRLVEAMVELCRGLGILVLAEGVESDGERAVLTASGCDLLQGFLIGRPAAI